LHFNLHHRSQFRNALDHLGHAAGLLHRCQEPGLLGADPCFGPLQLDGVVPATDAADQIRHALEERRHHLGDMQPDDVGVVEFEPFAAGDLKRLLAFVGGELVLGHQVAACGRVELADDAAVELEGAGHDFSWRCRLARARAR
jgi:hypothetical protein